MIDPVSQALLSREAAPWPWRPALIASLSLHLAVVLAMVIAPRARRSALTLPSVQVRIGALPVSAGPAPAQPVAAQRPAKPVPAKPRVENRPQPAHALPAPVKSPKKIVPQEPAAQESAPGPPQGQPGALKSASGAVGMGASGGRTDEVFPFDYYLNRLLGVIESNWFRPPGAPESRCRVRCRLDRSGHLLEAGIEEPSATAAFDRAALRAVYASAPFPALPQGFGGATLTLHLEFGP